MIKRILLCFFVGFLSIYNIASAELPYPDYHETNEALADNIELLKEEIKFLKMSKQSIEKQIEQLDKSVKRMQNHLEDLEYHHALTAKKVNKLVLNTEKKLNKLKEAVEAINNADKKTVDAFSNHNGENLIESQNLSAGDNIIAPEMQYKIAYEHLQANNFQVSINNFQEFIAKNPSHQLVANAYFWLGEAYFQLNDYENSSVQYLNSYQSGSNGQHSPDSLLKLGISLNKLGKNNEACVSFMKLAKEFPKASSTIKTQLKEQLKFSHCS